MFYTFFNHSTFWKNDDDEMPYKTSSGEGVAGLEWRLNAIENVHHNLKKLKWKSERPNDHTAWPRALILSLIAKAKKASETNPAKKPDYLAVLLCYNLALRVQDLTRIKMCDFAPRNDGKGYNINIWSEKQGI